MADATGKQLRRETSLHNFTENPQMQPLIAVSETSPAHEKSITYASYFASPTEGACASTKGCGVVANREHKGRRYILKPKLNHMQVYLYMHETYQLARTGFNGTCKLLMHLGGSPD